MKYLLMILLPCLSWAAPNDDLYAAVKLNDVNKARLAIAAGADVNFTVSSPWSPLIVLVSENDNLEMMKLFIENKADVEGTDGLGRTALSIATQGNNLELVKYMIESGADLEHAATLFHDEYHPDLPIAGPIASGNKAMFKLILGYIGSIDFQSSNGLGVLMVATREKKIDWVKYLLQLGANPNTVSKYENTTALMYAAENNCKECAALLIEHGADIEFQCDSFGIHDGHSPLTLAIFNKSLDVFKLLIDKKVWVNRMPDAYDHLSAISYAVDVEDPVFLETLLNAGAIANHIDSNRYSPQIKSPLMTAASRGSKSLVQLLLKHGANPCMQNALGYTAADYAASSDHYDLAQILKEQKCAKDLTEEAKKIFQPFVGCYLATHNGTGEVILNPKKIQSTIQILDSSELGPNGRPTKKLATHFYEGEYEDGDEIGFSDFEIPLSQGAIKDISGTLNGEFYGPTAEGQPDIYNYEGYRFAGVYIQRLANGALKVMTDYSVANFTTTWAYGATLVPTACQ